MNNITPKVSVDGRYHPMKEQENERRAADRDLSQSHVTEMFETIHRDDGENVDPKKAFQLVKKAA